MPLILIFNKKASLKNAPPATVLQKACSTRFDPVFDAPSAL
ncbi:hypothetical protein HMPREF7215_1661 [Pyramidobacter piscolens W5455]|uniref:Uncharacterized protein n=1 Tax=Pyramidobacter piscolens W5455 TaxID=352165 RepID=A0ABM9ZX39_9BACT|nr:hypothetical protein HMPREF7215_1661 [Pyramidobacter piscolens W5455]